MGENAVIDWMTSLRFTLAVALMGVHGGHAEAEEAGDDRFRLVANASAEKARLIASGISSIANLRVDAANIDIDWAVVQDGSIEGELDDASDLALLDLDKADLAALAPDSGQRALMKFWIAAEDAAANRHPGYLLTASPSVDDAFVQALLQAVQEDDLILAKSKIDVERLDPKTAMAALPLPVHQGAAIFLPPGEQPSSEAKTLAVHLPSARPADAPKPLEKTPLPVARPGQTPIPGVATRGLAPIGAEQGKQRSFTLYFDSDEAKLDRDDFLAVADACRYAATLKRARFVIAGHTDTVGPETYNDQLAERRAASVAKAIENDPRFREALSVIDHGEMMLAIATGDEIAEPRNRRVEITVVEED